MPFEEGKFYPNRFGKYVGPLIACNDLNYPWCKWKIKNDQAVFGFDMYNEHGAWHDTPYVFKENLISDEELPQIMVELRALQFNSLASRSSTDKIESLEGRIKTLEADLAMKEDSGTEELAQSIADDLNEEAGSNIYQLNKVEILLVVRQHGYDIFRSMSDVIRKKYEETVIEIDTTPMNGKNHIVAVFRYSKDRILLCGHDYHGTI